MDVITYLFHPQEKGHYLRREAVAAAAVVLVVVGGGNKNGGRGKNRERSFNMQHNHSEWVMNSL